MLMNADLYQRLNCEIMMLEKARKEYEIQRAAPPASPNAPQSSTSTLEDAKEVAYEKIQEPEDQDDMN